MDVHPLLKNADLTRWATQVYKHNHQVAFVMGVKLENKLHAFICVSSNGNNTDQLIKEVSTDIVPSDDLPEMTIHYPDIGEFANALVRGHWDGIDLSNCTTLEG